MPQGRRKVPFSGKAKKAQLQEKHNKNRSTTDFKMRDDVQSAKSEVQPEESASVQQVPDTDKAKLLMDVTFSANRGGGRGKYDLIFQKETKYELAERREKAQRPYESVPSSELETQVETFYPSSCDYPLRPEWNSSMTKGQVEANEAKYFREYVAEILEKHDKEENLSYFELNLETWRQLWRVVEMSDIVLLVIDARYPAAMLPPSLINGVNPKPVILVLNKVDLIPKALAVAWKYHIQEMFPNVSVAFFTSFPAYNLYRPVNQEKALQGRKLRGKISVATEGALQIFQIVEKIAADKKAINFHEWEKKIRQVDEKSSSETVEEPKTKEPSQLLTLGMVGFPNVGKSSLINSLIGRRVVSVSKTPGHTKHFQTIFVTPSIRLCDCPGLVFPSTTPRSFQVIMGSYPISQTREPFGVVQFLAERLDLPKILRLPESPKKWTTYGICEAWAAKRGFVTARSNRLDVARAANHIMRMALEGRLTLCLRPPGYKLEDWDHHPDATIVQELFGLERAMLPEQDSEEDLSSSDDEDEMMADQPTQNKFSALNID